MVLDWSHAGDVERFHGLAAAADAPLVRVVATLQRNGVPSYRTLSNQGVADDEQLNAWGAFVELRHPELGARRHVGAPWRLSQSQVAVERPAPRLYADTDRVLSEILGYDERDVRRLREAGAIARAPLATSRGGSVFYGPRLRSGDDTGDVRILAGCEVSAILFFRGSLDSPRRFDSLPLAPGLLLATFHHGWSWFAQFHLLVR